MNIGMFGPYVQIFEDEKDCLSELPDSHSLDIGLFGTYAQNYYVKRVYFSELSDIHTLDIGVSGPYVEIPDNWLYFQVA